MRYNPQTFSFGAEHELADYDRRQRLPKGCVNNRKDHTVVNSNGIANDPLDRLYHYGGEINTSGTTSIDQQCGFLQALARMDPSPVVNYRSNLHLHIRVPGLKDDLPMLKRVQRYIHKYMPSIFPWIEPLDPPSRFMFANAEEYAGAVKRHKRCLVSHHTLLTPKRIAFQMDARTPMKFFEAEVPHRLDGSVCWHLQPRLCVNLRQMLETDTIEFRHFPGTLDVWTLAACFRYCLGFIEHAMADEPLTKSVVREWIKKPLAHDKYNHQLELGYRVTCHDGSLTRDQIAVNIKALLAGTFPYTKN